MTLTTTVLITLLNDKRVGRTLRSLATQTRRPDCVLVADGGSTDGTLDVIAALREELAELRMEVKHLPGSVAATRAAALPLIATDVLVFLDSDQVAPDDWLEHLVAPLETPATCSDAVAFTGGPTRPLGPPDGPGEAYLNDFEAWFYPNVVAHDMSKVPMGNTAWRTRVLRDVGGFDTRLAWGGEDYDINVRVSLAGHRGHYVPAAWVYHDQAGRNDLRRLLRRKYRYNVGATMAYRKNGVLRAKTRAAAANTAAFSHPYERWNLLVQPFALVRGLLAWERVKRGRSP